MFTIGEFSKVTGLTVKTLRFYHEQGVLAPSCVDESSGYRYYNESKIETARVITYLRELDFSLAEIAAILRDEPDDAAMLDILERQRSAVEAKLRRLRQTAASLDTFIQQELEARQVMASASYEVVQKAVEPMLIAGIRMQGKYSDCGQAFSRIGRAFGRYICGKCMLLHYDTDYRENDANFEACMPVRKAIDKSDIQVRQLPGGHCVSLLHKGPYDTLGRSYAKILGYIKAHGLALELPSREVYIKGPGMIFRGNPKNYLTEIQMFLTGK